MLKDFEKVKVGKQELELWRLKEKIGKGEGLLGINHRQLDGMSGDVLIEYLQELRAKWKQRNIASGTASIAKVRASGGLNIPADIMDFADCVGKRYGITGQQICDRYLQIRKMDAFDMEAIVDLRENVLLDIEGKEESWRFAFVKPIKAGCLDTPAQDTTPEGSEHRPSFQDAIARIQLALKADWYYPREPFQLNGERITDFRATAKQYLKHVAEKEYHDRIIELAMTIPKLRTAGRKGHVL